MACATYHTHALPHAWQLDLGELVAQHLFLHLHDLWLDEEREWEDAPEGSVVFDSDPD